MTNGKGKDAQRQSCQNPSSEGCTEVNKKEKANMCLVLTDREGGDHVPCVTEMGEVSVPAASPGVIDEEIGPLRQFNTCCLHSMKPSLLPPKISPPLSHHQYIYVPVTCRTHI